jgi:hypothetical protein
MLPEWQLCREHVLQARRRQDLRLAVLRTIRCLLRRRDVLLGDLQRRAVLPRAKLYLRIPVLSA